MLGHALDIPAKETRGKCQTSPLHRGQSLVVAISYPTKNHERPSEGQKWKSTMQGSIHLDDIRVCKNFVQNVELVTPWLEGVNHPVLAPGADLHQ